jgi:hypothetical protein
MKRLAFLWTLTIVALTARGGPSGPGDLGAFLPGEEVSFSINDTVHVCDDELPYSIVQVAGDGQRKVMLEHSCIGIVGAGIDQYCENGQIETVEVRYCSDAIFCEDQEIRTTVNWDQREYVEISEECSGQKHQA